RNSGGGRAVDPALATSSPAPVDRNAPHGKGLPVLLPVASVGTGRPVDAGCIRKLSAGGEGTSLHPTHEGGNGLPGRATDLSHADIQHAELQPDSLRTGAIRTDDG